MPDATPNPSALALTALRFAAGDLPAEEAAAFAARIATDDAARDALERAFRLSAAALGQTPPAPDAGVRDAVRDRVRSPLLAKFFPRRPYRGHPVAWLGVGGTVAAGLAVFGVWLADPPDDPDPAPTAVVRPADEYGPAHATRVKVVDPHGGPVHTAVVKEMDERSGTMTVELVPDDAAADPDDKPGRGPAAVESPR